VRSSRIQIMRSATRSDTGNSSRPRMKLISGLETMFEIILRP
jgi:hypothetical protein